MVHLKFHHETPPVENPPHQHAFTIVGEEQLFGVHMTQYHCEVHKYQIILKLTLPEEVHQKFKSLRRSFPSDFFVLCNGKGQEETGENKEFSVPDLASGRTQVFTGNIFQGIRQPNGDPGPHFFPWDLDRVIPAIEDVQVTVDRIVLFRPFDHHQELPPYATYWLFGKGDEAHMTNLQTAALATSPFEPEAFGPDYDHVMSLESAPDWLQDSLLEAGIVVTAPGVPLYDPESGQPTIPCKPSFKAGDSVELLYRGIGPARSVTAGHTYLHCTAVCNSPSMIPCDGADACHISPMPKKYWR
jgi:hypothetical protein